MMLWVLVILLNPCMMLAWDYHCSFCHWGAKALIGYNERGHNQAEAMHMVAEGCYMLGIYPREVCEGMVNNVGRKLFIILDISNVRIAVPLSGCVFPDYYLVGSGVIMWQ